MAKTKIKKETKKKSVKKITSKTPSSMEELLASVGQQVRGFKRGEFVVGRVTEFRPKTIFFDIGGKTEGIITGKEFILVKDFISQLKVGDKVKVQVRVPENDKGQTLLSVRKTAFEHSWEFFKKAVKSGKAVVVNGREVNHGGTVVVAPFGLFGFIPGSQIGEKYTHHPGNLVGKRIEVRVLEVDQEKNRLVFSERMISEPDRVKKEREAVEKIKVGDKFKAKVARVEPFGLFIRIEPKEGKATLEGLVHISEISWEKISDLTKLYKADDEVKVCLVNKENDKLQFSIKRLTPDPWQGIAKKYPVDKEIKGEVVQMTSFGALVRLEPGVEGLIHISKFPPRSQLKEGDKVTCYIENVDPAGRRLSLVMALTQKPIGYK